jgi:4-amino-4-deoxy-L-arabinose transferase-like glycosyltransferase
LIRVRPRPRIFRLARPAALAIAVLLGLAGIFQHGLWTPDEPREAEVGREMLLSGFSPLPTLGGEPFVEKPPLFPWVMSAGYRVFGVSPAVARLPAWFFGIGAVLVAFELGRRAGGRLAGLAAALVLATTVKFAEVSHASVNDIALTFFVACGHLAFLVARDDHRLGRRSAAIPLAGLCAGLAFLTKAWIGPILLAGPPVIAALGSREWSFLRPTVVRLGLACVAGVLLLGLPWVLALAHASGWDPVRVCLVDNAIGRAVGGASNAAFGHARGPFDYLLTFPASFLPWTFAIPAVIAGSILAPDWRGGRTRFLGLVVVAGLLLLSIPSGKRDVYALPLFPAAAAVLGVWLSRVGSRRGSGLDRVALAALSAVLVLCGLAGAGALAAIVVQRVPEPLMEIARTLAARRGGEVLLAAAACLATLALWVAWLATRRSEAAAAARSFAAALLAFTFVAQAGLRPLIDPAKDLREGALEIARSVPESEPLLGLALDETTRAVVPFYTGRLIRSVETSERALAELESGPARHLVVQEGAERRLDEATRKRLSKVAAVRFNPTRSATLYRFEPERGAPGR